MKRKYNVTSSIYDTHKEISLQEKIDTDISNAFFCKQLKFNNNANASIR